MRFHKWDEGHENRAIHPHQVISTIYKESAHEIQETSSTENDTCCISHGIFTFS